MSRWLVRGGRLYRRHPDGSGDGYKFGGPTCSPCAAGLACQIAGDCASGVCTSNVCAAPICSDSVRNSTETDVDCGGPCSPCLVNALCAVAADCQSHVCVANHCLAATCTDTVQNGNETAAVSVPRVLSAENQFRRFGFCEDGRTIAATDGKSVWRIDWPTGAVRAQATPFTVEQPPCVLRALGSSADGKWWATNGPGGSVAVRDAATGASAQTLAADIARTNSIAFSPDGQWLAAGGLDNDIHVWDARSWRKVTTVVGARHMRRSRWRGRQTRRRCSPAALRARLRRSPPARGPLCAPRHHSSSC